MSNVAEEALNIIERRGWENGGLGTKTGPVCLVGALSEVCFGGPRDVQGNYDRLTEVIPLDVQEALVKAANDENIIGIRSVGELHRLNDHFDVDEDVVKRVLRKAAEATGISETRIGAWIRR